MKLRIYVPLRPILVYMSLGSVIFGLSIIRIHLRLKTTLIGYEIGKVKEIEANLKVKQSELRMVHAKVSTFKHLNLMSQLKDDNLATSGKLAQK